MASEAKVAPTVTIGLSKTVAFANRRACSSLSQQTAGNYPTFWHDDLVVELARAIHLREITLRWLRAANVLLEYPADMPGLLEPDACKFGDVVKHQRGLMELVAEACRYADFESAERYLGAVRLLKQRHDCAATCD